MGFDADFDVIRDTVLDRDPAFYTVNKADLASSLRTLEHIATSGHREPFILAAMKTLALAQNGHTRIIPNTAISTVPCRFVAIGPRVFLTQAPEDHIGCLDSQVLAVNGTAVEAIFTSARPYLAGTPARQRAIFPILLAWPAALSQLGVPSVQRGLTLEVLTPSGDRSHIAVSSDETVPAQLLYPSNENGLPNADPGPGFVTWHRDKTGVQVVALKSFFDPDGDTLAAQINEASDRISQHPEDNLILDLRGNTGGDFTLSLRLLDTLHTGWRGTRCVALIDKFTFSAAIVFVALLTHRLKDRVSLMGEDMGDGLRFYAEGDRIHLPDSGALLRYSDAYHDWDTGTPDKTTPKDISKHLVAAGPLPAIQTVDASAKERRSGPDPLMVAAMACLAKS